MIDIYIMWSTLIYLVIGLLVCLLLLKKACGNKKINTRNKTMGQFANDHALEVFLIVFVWPLYLLLILVLALYIMLCKKKHK